MKVITVKGCKDCPYQTVEYRLGVPIEVCRKGYWQMPFGHSVSETPHPDCKLNDLPTNSDIVDFALDCSDVQLIDGIIAGGGFVLNKIEGNLK